MRGREQEGKAVGKRCVDEKWHSRSSLSVLVFSCLSHCSSLPPSRQRKRLPHTVKCLLKVFVMGRGGKVVAGTGKNFGKEGEGTWCRRAVQEGMRVGCGTSHCPCPGSMSVTAEDEVMSPAQW